MNFTAFTSGPIQELRVGTAAPALWHGGSTMAEVTFKGQPAHGARPHLGKKRPGCSGAGHHGHQRRVGESGGAVVGQSDPAYIAAGPRPILYPERAELSLDIRAATNPLMAELVA
jgi:amidohydrolase